MNESILRGKVTEILLDKYIVKLLDDKNEVIEVFTRGNIKKKTNILVGDIVKLERAYDKLVIIEVEARKNELIRPPVSNIDTLVIVISIYNPEPDYILLDKQIAFCISHNIEPVICVNKVDIENETVANNIKYIDNVYGKLGIDIVYTSAKESTGIKDLVNILENKTSAFSGNSGVGKSSITKTIVGEDKIEVNSISQKGNRGRHTTKYVKLYEINDNTYILDTPGFSSYELYNIEAKELKNYYPEFLNCKCDYDDCNHIKEDISVCDVKRKLSDSTIDKGRYERYVYIFDKLKEKEDKKYK